MAEAGRDIPTMYGARPQLRVVLWGATLAPTISDNFLSPHSTMMAMPSPSWACASGDSICRRQPSACLRNDQFRRRHQRWRRRNASAGIETTAVRRAAFENPACLMGLLQVLAVWATTVNCVLFYAHNAHEECSMLLLDNFARRIMYVARPRGERQRVSE